MSIRILQGDCRDVLKTLPYESAHCVVTSPPYFGLRDYGMSGQIGLEGSPARYIEALVSVFMEIGRVLRDDGTLWLNLGDSYADKALLGIPWRVAFALQAAGWNLRQDIIWHKPNPMPESVKDRCTKAHEYIFLFSKRDRYYFDSEAIAESAQFPGSAGSIYDRGIPGQIAHKGLNRAEPYTERNKRSVWTVPPLKFRDAHFATFPPDLIEPCILAGCPEGGTVLDPFGGAGTTGLVADRHGRDAILIELNPEYAEMARKRIINDSPLFVDVQPAASATRDPRIGGGELIDKFLAEPE
jgi:DNA modification methylase